MRLQDENSKIKVRHQRQEETIQDLRDVNSRQDETIDDVMNDNKRLRDEISKMKERHQRTNQLEEYCFFYYWLLKDCHVSLETPAGTYISIHPPGTKGFHPNHLNVVQSLEEDIKRLGHPAEIFPLFGLNFHDIDEWYRTIDEHHEQDYSMLETALKKGSNDFKNYLAKYKPSNAKSPHYIYSAAWDYSH